MTMLASNRARLAQWLIWFAAAILLTLLMLLVREQLDKAHIALLFLLPVLGAAAQGGRRLGLAIAAFTFVCFNFFFLPPHYTLVVSDARDWLVLGIYLITASVAAHLLYQARTHAARAQQLAASEEALQQADRMKDALLAAVSHDLRTPLTTIKALAHDLVEAGNLNAVDIENQADHLNRLVGDLLDLSRLKAGAMPSRPEINAAEDVIGALIEQLAPVLPDRPLIVSLDTAAPLLLGKFDFVHALRILGNLVENSDKYSPHGSPIEIGAFRRDDRLVFSVADRGAGIPPADSERIYDAFYRGSHPRHAPGAGLGLSIARQLAQLQGGALLHTTRRGGGTVFCFEVPWAEAPS